MTKQISFTKQQHQVLPEFRRKISHAESTEDIKKFFYGTTRELFDLVFEGQMDLNYDDIGLMPGSKDKYWVSERLLNRGSFKTVWNQSDLSTMVGRFARTSLNRYVHLEKHPEKTNAKIRM